jgi:hypothetical protein
MRENLFVSHFAHIEFLGKIEIRRMEVIKMRHKRMEAQNYEHPHIEEVSTASPNVENAIMKLVVDSYLHGAQTCELHDGKILGVSIHHGKSDNIHLFIDNNHRVTVEVKNGMSRISVVKNKHLDDIDYVLPFTKCLGLHESIVMKNYEDA